MHTTLHRPRISSRRIAAACIHFLLAPCDTIFWEEKREEAEAIEKQLHVAPHKNIRLYDFKYSCVSETLRETKRAGEQSCSNCTFAPLGAGSHEGNPCCWRFLFHVLTASIHNLRQYPGVKTCSPGARDLDKEAFHTQIHQTTTDAGAEFAAENCPQGCSKEEFHTQFPERLRLLELKKPARYPQQKESCTATERTRGGTLHDVLFLRGSE